MDNFDHDEEECNECKLTKELHDILSHYYNTTNLSFTQIIGIIENIKLDIRELTQESDNDPNLN